MKLETAVEVWTKECHAHGYVGFIVVDNNGTIDRVFLHAESELEPAKTSMRVHGHNIIQEVII